MNEIIKILGDSPKSLRALTIQQAVASIEAHGRKIGLKTTLDERLLLLIKAVVEDDPSWALDLCNYLIEIGKESIEIKLIAGIIEDRLGNRKKAQKFMEQIINDSDSKPILKMRAANLLVRYGNQEDALRVARQAYADLNKPIEHAGTLLYIAQVTADWDLCDELTGQIKNSYQEKNNISVVNESPRTHLLWCDDENLNIEVVKNWSKKTFPKINDDIPRIEPLVNRKIRVGYLSSDFREHPTARLINGLLRNHDRNQFEIFMYCSGWDDRSEMRKELESHFDHIHSVAKMADSEAADLIRSHKIDVLVELNGPTRANRMGILAQRPAPIQIDYLGWPGSVGGRVIDYIIGDKTTIPAGLEKIYPEKVIRIEQVYQINDYASRSISGKKSRKDLGLPEGDYIILGMFNAINKVSNEVWDAWMRILEDVPNTILWILDPGPIARKHIANACLKRGISVKRVMAAPRLPEAQHLSRLQQCDLILDPWPYGGHTSTADALFAGVPVIALNKNNFAGRVSGALLKAAGLGILVKTSVDDYVSYATELLRNPSNLRKLKQYLKDRVMQTDVFDAKAKTRQIEVAYREALNRRVSNKPLINLNIKLTSNYRVAIVTPYYRIEPEKLERCCQSVKYQSMHCDHILVADGEPQKLPDGYDLIHLVLPANVGNSGATPRAFGAQYAFAQGYDAVAFLDADNWYEPNHVELAIEELKKGSAEIVFARRNIIFPDGEIMPFDDPEDMRGTHVDTNCYVISKKAAYVLGVWSMYPKEFGTGEDRLMFSVIKNLKIRTAYLDQKTVWYETNWRMHYALMHKTPEHPVRSPAKTIFKNFDQELFFSRTGFQVKK